MSHKPIALLDVETTGLDPDKDRIIDLAIVYVEAGAINQDMHPFRFNPGIPIPPGATAIHGITDADVEGFPRFAEAAEAILKLLAGCDIAGYHPRLLDLPMLAAEFDRAGFEWEHNGLIFDVAGVFMKNHPRDLSAAVKVYLGREHTGRHGAMADALATAQVMLAQVGAHPELALMTPEEYAAYGRMCDDEPIDLRARLARNKDGEAYFTFGMNKGKLVRQCRSYCDWMLRSGFASETKRKLRDELNRIDGIRINETTGQPEAEIPF